MFFFVFNIFSYSAFDDSDKGDYITSPVLITMVFSEYVSNRWSNNANGGRKNIISK